MHCLCVGWGCTPPPSPQCRRLCAYVEYLYYRNTALFGNRSELLVGGLLHPPIGLRGTQIIPDCQHKRNPGDDLESHRQLSLYGLSVIECVPVIYGYAPSVSQTYTIVLFGHFDNSWSQCYSESPRWSD